MPATIQDRIDERDPALIGRDRESAALQPLLEPNGPLVAFVHGLGGVGKSALLRSFAATARCAGAAVVTLDGATFEPTQRGFLAALSAATGSELTSIDGLAARFDSLGSLVVVVLDEYDALRAIDPWLCRVVVPALSDRTRLLIAGREAPIPDWPARLGGLLQVIALGNLAPASATALLAAEGVAATETARIERLARGHPLSLRLAAAALRSSSGLDAGDPDFSAIVSPITRLYLDALDPVTRSVVDAASVVRRPTRSLLTAMLPDGPRDAFERLSGLPFVEPTVDGLAIHATVREVVAASLRADDPERSVGHRIAAWRALRREVVDASPTHLWRYTADLLYLVENETLHDAFFPTTERRFVVDEARPEDWAVIRQLSARHFPGEAQDDLEAWWQHAPWAFRVARSRTGDAAGFAAHADLDRLPRALVDVDPIARHWRDHRRRFPVPAGRTIITQRFERADPDDPDDPSIHAALILDLYHAWMAQRPGLARHYGSGRMPIATTGTTTGTLAVDGTQALSDAPTLVGGSARYPFFIDFGAGSVDGWLARLIAKELHIDGAPLLDVAHREIVRADGRVPLTTLEFAVLQYLFERPGMIVDRPTLLRDVWGYDAADGSNVIDVLVGSIRRKLGEHARALQTVRGLGYRFDGTA